MKFISYGIHTRLHYVIKKANGIDKVIRREWLKNKYGFDAETLDLVLMYDIENLIKEKDIEEIKSLILEKKSSDRLKSKRAMRNLTSMLTTLCCNSNMFHPGSYF